MASEERTPPAPASERLANDTRPAPIAPLAVIAVVASVLGVALGLLIDWFPTPASEQAKGIDTLYDVLLAASVPMFVLVVAVVLYSVHRFRMRPGQEDMDGPPIHGNTKLEVIWTIIPAVMMLALCTYAYVILHDAEKAPAATAPKELNVTVVGEQFTWTFMYPGEKQGDKQIVSTQLYLPVDRSVKFTVRSKDVLHDFWVPEFRMKIDAVPGITTSYRVTPNRPGVYPVVCAELCGLGHATMRQNARVVSGAEFDKWLADKRAGSPAGGGGAGGAQAGGATGEPEPDGKTIFTSAAQPSCGACHALADAGTSGGVGPDLDEVLPGQDAAFIKESIVDPEAKVEGGFPAGVMPTNYGQTLSEAEIDALVKYLQEATKG